VARALTYESGELSIEKREGGLIEGHMRFFHSLFTKICCICERKAAQFTFIQFP
jgi:hypothetical protein